MIVRKAVPADLKQCTALDHHYTTTHVWQINRREENGAMMLSFRSVRLPRSMSVRYPRDPEQLWAEWAQWDSFLVADDDGYLRGYTGLLAQPAEGRGWIRHLIVGRPHRRAGIGTALLQAVMQWASAHDLRHLTMEMQSKNYPAIRFCQKHGFQFCGFSEAYYRGQDIALFFAQRLV